MIPAILIGVDGGGTGCRARVRAGAGVGEGVGGPANIRLGAASAWASVMTAVDAALASIGLGPDALADAAIGLGLAGIVDEASGAAFLRAGPCFARAQAVSDGHAACLGAFDGADGAILISGTGSAGFAVIEGRGVPMFGWGFEIGDRGSAAALGRRALHAATDAVDGLGPESELTGRIFAATGGGRAALVDWVTRARPRDFGALAPIVVDLAGAGDALAIGLMREAAADLGAMIARLHAIGAARVCLLGGMAPHVRPWLAREALDLLAEPLADAVEGALVLARSAPETPR